MQIYIDSADLNEIREVTKLGIVSGATTNPSLMMQSGRADYKEVVREICYLLQNHISAEVIGTDAEAMLAEAQEIATWSPYVVVKIPTIPQGLAAMDRIREAEVDLDHLCQGCKWYGKCGTSIDEAREIAGDWGIQTNATLVFSANQALFAANAGASYVSPFVGRLDDIDHDGMRVVADSAAIFANYAIETQIIAASIRHPLHITQAALAGADIATVPYGVLMKALRHPLTDIGVERFLADWAKVPKH